MKDGVPDGGAGGNKGGGKDAVPCDNAPAARVAALFAVDPVGLGGVCLRAAAGPARDAWFARLAAMLPEGTPVRRMPLHINEDRLLGGLDLTATLQAGRPMVQRGLLAEADGGIVVLAMAERIARGVAARVAAVMDGQELLSERHGVETRRASRFGVVAFDEGIGDEEGLPARLLERMAFHVQLDDGPWSEEGGRSRQEIDGARTRLGGVVMDDDAVHALCAAALSLGVDSVRAPIFACRVARAAAALDGRDGVEPSDVALAAALVLAPRATRLPPPEASTEETVPESQEAAPPDSEAEPAAPADQRADPDADSDPAPTSPAAATDEVVLEAARAAIPPGLLALLALGPQASRRPPAGSGAGVAQIGSRRGRPAGVVRGEPQGGARLNLIQTLRAAAPWQLLRRREASGLAALGDTRVLVRRSDFHVWRYQQRSETTTVFVVDASGSAALHRLAEAKGAVELLLADCYVRRDSVAVIAFRGAGAELLLPPTRSLVRAKRSLAGLPGGGGTPLAAGIESARALADSVRRRGATPVLVLLTDGRGNIARDGTPGRARATADALAAALSLRADRVATLLLDTSPQPQPSARELAAAMGARYLPLPHAGAALVSQAVRAAATA